MRDWLLVGRELLDSHLQQHWQIRWMARDSKVVCARIIPKSKVIELNKAYFEKTTYTPILFDTLLHEVAHAIDLGKRQITRHDARWRAIYMSIGGTGKTQNEQINTK